jgi:C4-dicarboxylate transporter DctM subunit
MATVFANAVFASITGISIASATVFSRVAVPEMTRHGYSRKFSTGVVAGSSVLGMLIPPSLLMIVYAVLAEQSVGRMFLPGIGPGLLLALIFSGGDLLLARFRPGFVFEGPMTTAPAEDITTWCDYPAQGRADPVADLPCAGRLYGGFSIRPKPGASARFGALILALMLRSLTGTSFWGIMVETGQITVSVLFLIMAATFFSRMLTLSGLPRARRRLPDRAHRAVRASCSSISCWSSRWAA